MKPDLNLVKTEIEKAITDRGLVLFRGLARPDEPLTASVRWDTERYPDYTEFLAAALALESKVIVFHDRAFSEEEIEEASDNLESVEMPRDEYRDYERRLARLREYVGFTAVIELSFEHNADAYVFELVAPWYTDFLDIDEELEMISGAGFGDEEEDSGPLGGFYSKN